MWFPPMFIWILSVEIVCTTMSLTTLWGNDGLCKNNRKLDNSYLSYTVSEHDS